MGQRADMQLNELAGNGCWMGWKYPASLAADPKILTSTAACYGALLRLLRQRISISPDSPGDAHQSDSIQNSAELGEL